MAYAYFDRLSSSRKRIYLRSDATTELRLPAGVPVHPILTDIQLALTEEQRLPLQRASQRLLDELTGRFAVPPVTVRVKTVRPSGNWGELHGLYEPGDPGATPVISTWMRTVARKQMVAYKTFVRTLVHELVHHLDYELLKLPETFHTEGFYKREASLFRQLHQEPAVPFVV
jgi:hypothetical protein